VTVRARLFDARGDDRDVDIAELARLKVDDRQLLWVDLDERSQADLEAVSGALALEPRIVRQLGRDRRKPRLVRQPERIAVTLTALERDGEGEDLSRKDLDLVAGRNHVVTLHEGPIRSIDEYDHELRDERDLGLLDAGAFMTGLVDTVLTAYLREVEAIEREVDALDQAALRGTGDDDTFLPRVVGLRHRIALIRRSLTPNREALSPLIRPDFEAMDDVVRPGPRVVERLEQVISAVENARELLVGSFDIYLGRSAQRSNDVMKTLTIVSSILLPSVVLAGVMGMNFKLSFFDNPSNFFFVIGAMVVFAMTILVVARWRRWI
jgi:magnesium/cobalt transport protein CorA